MKNLSPAPEPNRVLRKLALYGLIGLVSCYVLVVAAGYSWLRYARKNTSVSVVDVALFRVTAVRRSIAAQQFAKAKEAWEAKNYQAAFLAYSFAVQQDPANILGRLEAADFLRTIGADKLAIVQLEVGLTRTPQDQRLIKKTFDALTGAGRDRQALELLHRLYGEKLAGEQGPMLQNFKVLATLSAEGGEAAKNLLANFPELAGYPPAIPVIARIYRETAERLKASDLLEKYIVSQPARMEDYALLATWQEADGRPDRAMETARLSWAKFPKDLTARVLLLEMTAVNSVAAIPAQSDIESYLHDFADRPEVITQLATLCGRKGWMAQARTLYELGAVRQSDIGLLALAFGDALVRNNRIREAAEILGHIEAQSAEASPAFLVQLRLRQVVVAAALRQSEEVREYARRLAVAMRNDTEAIERSRKYCQKVGIPEAVAELSERPVKVRAVPVKSEKPPVKS